MISRGDLAKREADEMLATLTAHFGEPVMPASRYCKAFEQWADAICAKAEREKDAVWRDENIARIAALRPAISMAIYKSSLLGRLIYGGEKLRTEMCPEHKGIWSGLEFVGDAHGCPHGCQLTGWLPKHSGAAPGNPQQAG